MARQLWEQAELTTADQMNELTREAAQRFQTAAEADGAYDPTAPAVAGQVRLLTGPISEGRVIVPETGRLTSARPLNEFRVERYDGSRWVDDAILPTPLQVGWQVASLAVDEPASGTATATGRLITNRPAGTGGTTIYITTSDGTATAPNDYVAKTREAVVIPQGQSGVDVVFTINASPVSDPTETFTCAIVGASDGTWGATNNADYRQDTITITIGGDTTPITLTVADASVTEGTAASLTITASRTSPQPITGNWAAAAPAVAAPRQAKEGDNYQLPVRTARNWQINAGTTSTAIQVPTINTATIEPGLLLDVSLTDIVSNGATLAPTGNDLTARVVISDTTPPTSGVIATVGPTAPALLRLNKASNTWVMFDYNLINRWSISGDNRYVRYTGTIIIPPGSITYSYTFIYPPADNEPASTGYNPTTGALSGTISTVGQVKAATSHTFAEQGRTIVARFFSNPINCTLNQTVR